MTKWQSSCKLNLTCTCLRRPRIPTQTHPSPPSGVAGSELCCSPSSQQNNGGVSISPLPRLTRGSHIFSHPPPFF